MQFYILPCQVHRSYCAVRSEEEALGTGKQHHISCMFLNSVTQKELSDMSAEPVLNKFDEIGFTVKGSANYVYIASGYPAATVATPILGS